MKFAVLCLLFLLLAICSRKHLSTREAEIEIKLEIEKEVTEVEVRLVLYRCHSVV